MSDKEVSGTIVRVRCMNAMVKIIYHRGLAVEELSGLEDRIRLVRTFEDLAGEVRHLARQTRQTCSIICEESRRRAA